MSVKQRMKDYWAEKGIPDQPPDATPTPVHWKLAGSIVVFVVGFLATGVLMLPFAAALWHFTSLPALLIALPGLFLSHYTGVYIGGPIADELLGIEREVAQ